MTEYIILIPLAILILELIPTVIRDAYLNKNQKHIMFGIIGLIILLIVQNVADYILQTVIRMPYIRTLESIVGYSVRPIIIILFCKLVRPNGKYIIARILAVINALIYLTATFSRFAFYIDENNHYHGGFFYFGKTVFVVCFILLFHLIYCTVKGYRKKKTWLWIPIVNIILIMLSSLLDISSAYRNYPVSYLTIAIVCCSLFYYIWLHLEFVKAHEKALMAEQRIHLMMSQILFEEPSFSHFVTGLTFPSPPPQAVVERGGIPSNSRFLSFRRMWIFGRFALFGIVIIFTV